jgi:hypothetical protein
VKEASSFEAVAAEKRALSGIRCDLKFSFFRGGRRLYDDALPYRQATIPSGGQVP